MTAPARAGGPAARTRTKEPRERTAERTAERRASTTTRGRSAAAERAYARRDQRRDRWRVVPQRTPGASSRAPFVLLVMGLLCAGLVTSLWLSISATTGSYDLQQARSESRELSAQVEQLQRDVAQRNSAAELAKQAARLGMVPAVDPARLVPRPDGTVDVVGDPTPAEAPRKAAPQTTSEQPPAEQQRPVDQASPEQQAVSPPAVDQQVSAGG